MIIDLGVRRGNQNAGRAVGGLVAADVAVDFLEGFIQQFAIPRIDGADVAKVEPHAALLDRLDDVFAFEAADVALAPSAARRTLGTHFDQRILRARIAIDEIGKRIEREQRVLVEAMGRFQGGFAPRSRISGVQLVKIGSGIRDTLKSSTAFVMRTGFDRTRCVTRRTKMGRTGFPCRFMQVSCLQLSWSDRPRQSNWS